MSDELANSYLAAAIDLAQSKCRRPSPTKLDVATRDALLELQALRQARPAIPADARCISCQHFGRPHGKQARADYAFPCTAPEPSIGGVPHSVAITMRRGLVTRDDGRGCPAWSAK